MDPRSAKQGATILDRSGAPIAGGESRAEFCGSLRAAREQAGLSIEDITRITRIPEHQLRRLEAGEFEGLPGDVFVRGFLRSYARCVGADPDDTVARYAACGGLAPAPVASDLARVAAEQAAALADHDDAEVVRGSARSAVGLARGTRPSSDRPIAERDVEATSSPVAAAGAARPGRTTAPGMSSVRSAASGAATPSGRSTSSVSVSADATSGAPAPGSEEREARSASPPPSSGSNSSGPDGSAARSGAGKKRGSKRSRRGREGRRRGPTVVPPPGALGPSGEREEVGSSVRSASPATAGAAAPGRASSAAAPASREPQARAARVATSPGRAASPGRASPAGAASPGRSERRGLADALRRGPVLLALAVIALVVAAILVMSHLLREPERPTGGRGGTSGDAAR